MGYLSQELADVVAEAYRTARREPPPTIGVCTAGCCMPAAMAQEMLATPVPDIPLRHIQEWHDAASERLSLSHLLWLMPRQFDLLAQNQEVAQVGLQVVFSRTKHTRGVQDWPKLQSDLFHRFAAAHVDAVARRPQIDLEEILCMYGLSGMDMAPILARFDAMELEALAQAVVSAWGRGLVLGWDAFWGGQEALTALRAWFGDPSMIARMTDWAIETGSVAGLAAVPVLETISAQTVERGV